MVGRADVLPSFTRAYPDEATVTKELVDEGVDAPPVLFVVVTR